MRAGNVWLIPPIFAFLFGGAGFVWGTRRGKQNEYLAMGVVGGVALGLVITQFGGKESHEQAAIAGLTPRDIANLKTHRETANRIVEKILRKAHPIPEHLLKAGQFGQQYY